MLISWRTSRWIRKIVPGPVVAQLQKIYTVYHARLMRRYEKRLQQLFARLFPERPPVVAGGPFQGMKYVETAVGSELIPKLIGSYEMELSGIIEKIARDNYETVLDIGCAEGYYVVGLAMQIPKATVYGFDLEPKAMRLCAEMAAVNEVAAQVIVKGACTPATFDELVHGKTLIICDCEGYEMELLNPEKSPKLIQTDLLVELHGCTDPEVSITEVILERFRPTHKITLIPATFKRDASLFPILNPLEPSDRQLALQEFRANTKEWVFLEQAS